ncbi:MAG: Gfo/Idh/MocA family oxidoreductase [Kiritimatiellae bacterium]|nr:Gfo/Idh/MocA family oxidoreductase [Kiritimatiellia bacterium]
MLRVAVIGMGPIGNLHAEIYKQDPLAQLVAVCDIIAERARAAGERLEVPWFTSAPEMLEAVRPDVCSVTTGGFEYASDHYEPTIQALRAGCHVLCEKPLCNEVSRCAEMVRVAREMRKCLGVNFNHRFTPASRLAKQWVDEGKIGPLLFVNVSLWIGRQGDFDSPYFHLKALNPHSVDIMRYFAGDITEVQCFAMKAPGRRNLWSTASINIRFKCGAVGHITSSYDIARGHPMERCEVAGLSGRLVIEDMWREVTLYPAGNPVKAVYTNPIFGGFREFRDTFRERLHCFLQEVSNGTAPDQIDGSGEAGLAAQKVIAAAIESLETGKIVSVS